MSVKIREKRGKLYLDIYQGGKRTWEALHLELTKDKVQNKEIWRLAEICRSKRETQFLTGAWDINDPISGKMSLIKYMEDYAKTYKKPAPVNCCINYIKIFQGNGIIQLSQITPKWVDDFQFFLLKQERISQNTASFYARILCSALNRAVFNEMILKNPANRVKKITTSEPELDFLSFQEVKALAEIAIDDPYGAVVRRAFLFGCYTGLRIIDIETLTWSRIKSNPMRLIKSQEKTKKNVYLDLHKNAQTLILDDKPHEQDETVFDFLGRNRRSSYSRLKKWARAAGLTKKIGWQTARRTFATLTLEKGADISTVAKLLGHAKLSHVAKYAKVTDKLKAEAISRLPDIGI